MNTHPYQCPDPVSRVQAATIIKAFIAVIKAFIKLFPSMTPKAHFFGLLKIRHLVPS